MKLYGCFMEFYDDNEMAKGLAMVRYLAAEVTSYDPKNHTICFNCSSQVIMPIIKDVKFSIFKCASNTKDTSTPVFVDKDNNGNITCEEYSDGFKESNTYDNNKLTSCRTTYPNGVTEFELYS